MFVSTLYPKKCDNDAEAFVIQNFHGGTIMKKLSKIIAVISAAALIASALAGCGDKEETTDGKNFTYWAVMDSFSQATLKSYSEMLFYQKMEEATGVHIDFIHPIEGSTGNEAFIAMLSGAEIPDMIEYNWANYSGGPQQALDDDVLIELNDYLEEYAPNYYDNLEGEKGKAADYLYKLQASTDDGRYYGFNVLDIGVQKGFCGIYARADLLEKWYMSVPETIDEWTAFFAKAKSEGFDKPFTCGNNYLSFGSDVNQAFNSAYDVGKNFYLEGDTVVFAPFQKGYKEYVAQMAEWVKAGYIDTGFVTNDAAKIESNLYKEVSVAACGYVGSGIGKILPAAKEQNPEFDLVGCPFPAAKKGGTTEFQQVNPAATALAIGISTSCGNVEKAVEWCDYIYSEEGMEYQLFGVEGDTYTIVERDGEKHYQYTDKLVKNFRDEGFASVSEALYHYMLPTNHPGYNQHQDYLYGYYELDRQKEAVQLWNLYADEAVKHALPKLSYTEEETREITDIEEVAFAELEVALNDIILGKQSIDTYDAAIKAAKDNGYDRWLEIVQGAYDRYLSKLDK